MDRSRLHELKERDLRLERGPVFSLHVEDACHGSEGSGQGAAGCVLERLAGFEHGLLSDDARPVYLFGMSRAIDDRPMPVQQLDGRFTLVGDADRIEEEPSTGRRITVFRREIGDDVHAHAMGDGSRSRFEDFRVTHGRERSIGREGLAASAAP